MIKIKNSIPCFLPALYLSGYFEEALIRLASRIESVAHKF